MEEKNEDEVIVYWAPNFTKGPGQHEVDWNILYPDPSGVNDPAHVYSSFRHSANKDLKDKATNSVLMCPAHKSMFTNVYSLSSLVGGNYVLATENGVTGFGARVENSVGLIQVREPSFTDQYHLTMTLSWYFFSEEPLEMEVTPPYSSGAPHMKYGTMVPGSFDIGRWFRPLNAEFILHKGVEEFIIEAEEPMMYIKFLTKKKVVLKRFSPVDGIDQISSACAQSFSIFGRYKTMEEKYDYFTKSSTDKKVLSLIKKNLY
jgi:hypothetical protein